MNLSNSYLLRQKITCFRDFFLIENKKSSIEELVAVTLVTLLALLVGLGILIVAYYR